MDPREILNFCLEKGLLLDKELLNLFSETNDIESVKLIIEKIKNHTSQKIITKKLFNKNIDQVDNFFRDLPEENRKNLESLKIKLGLSIEISREKTEVLDSVHTFKKLLLRSGFGNIEKLVFYDENSNLVFEENN